MFQPFQQSIYPGFIQPWAQPAAPTAQAQQANQHLYDLNIFPANGLAPQVYTGPVKQQNPRYSSGTHRSGGGGGVRSKRNNTLQQPDHRGTSANSNDTSASAVHQASRQTQQQPSFYHQQISQNHLTSTTLTTHIPQPQGGMPKSNSYTGKSASDSHYSSNKSNYHNSSKNDDRSSTSSVPQQHYNATYSYSQQQQQQQPPHHYYHPSTQQSYEVHDSVTVNKNGNQPQQHPDHDDTSSQPYAGRQPKDSWVSRPKGRRRRDDIDNPRGSYNYGQTSGSGNNSNNSVGGGSSVNNNYNHSTNQKLNNTAASLNSNTSNATTYNVRERGDRSERRDRNVSEHHHSGGGGHYHHNYHHEGGRSHHGGHHSSSSGHGSHDAEKSSNNSYNSNSTHTTTHNNQFGNNASRTQSDSNPVNARDPASKETTNQRTTQFDLKQAAFPPLPGSTDTPPTNATGTTAGNGNNNNGGKSANSKATVNQVSSFKPFFDPTTLISIFFHSNNMTNKQFLKCPYKQLRQLFSGVARDDWLI